MFDLSFSAGQLFWFGFGAGVLFPVLLFGVIFLAAGISTALKKDK